jgi:predicted glycosyltransferase
MEADLHEEGLRSRVLEKKRCATVISPNELSTKAMLLALHYALHQPPHGRCKWNLNGAQNAAELLETRAPFNC